MIVSSTNLVRMGLLPKKELLRSLIPRCIRYFGSMRSKLFINNIKSTSNTTYRSVGIKNIPGFEKTMNLFKSCCSSDFCLIQLNYIKELSKSSEGSYNDAFWIGVFIFEHIVVNKY